MAEAAEGQMANLHLDEVTGEKVRCVQLEKLLYAPDLWPALPKQQERAQEENQAARTWKEEAREGGGSSSTSREAHVSRRGGK